jgi:hypothetical protein
MLSFTSGYLRPAVPAIVLAALFAAAPLRAGSLAEYAATHEIKIFVPTKGAVMPNPYDDPGHLKLDTPALLLSGLGLTDLTGISKLMVDFAGRRVPITAVPNLHVYLNHNGYTALPEEIGALKNVAFLYCEKNRLRTLPRSLRQMDSLIAMYFTDNEFTEIPAFVFEMTNLRKLQFSKNRIEVLPPAIGQLKELRHFSVAGNRIEVLPETIANLTRVRVCDLSDNRLTRIPDAFGEVRIENQLRVRNNPLTSLPLGFARMRATIDITGTKIDPARLPPELRAKISTEKPPGSKDPDAIVVLKPAKSKP